MKKVLIITYYWPPAGGPGTQRWLKFVKYLAKSNNDIHVITVDPHKASYPIVDTTLGKDIPANVKIHYTNSIEFLNIYKKVNKTNDIPHGGFANISKKGFKEKLSKFIRGNLFIPDIRRGWNSFAYKQAKKVIEQNEIDTIITTSPPHSTQLIGIKLKKKFKRIKWIADIRDPWVDIFYYKELYHTWLASQIDRHYEKKVLVRCDKCIVVSNSIKKLFEEKYKYIGEGKIEIIPNGYDEDDFTPRINFDSNTFYLTYTGTMSDIYNISALLSAIAEIDATFEVPFVIRIIGKVSNAIYEKIINSSVAKYFEFIDYVNHNEVPSYLMQSAALLLVIPDIEKNEGILTGKLFEYLGSQRPIVCIGPKHGDAAKIIKGCNAGKIFENDDSEELRQFIEELLSSWQENNLGSYGNNNNSNYSRESLTEHLISLLP